MNRELAKTLPERARSWAIALTEQKSVTGTQGEAAFGPWLAARLREDPAFRRADIWTIEVEPGDGRHCVAMLLRGTGRWTVLLTGHYDTVATRDYGELEELATRPEALTRALRNSLADADTPAARLARADLESGEYLAGRGLLDMKAGLAAGLAVCAHFAESTNTAGNLLFIAVPDEENNSAGARKAAPSLPGIYEQHGLDLVAAVNLDAIADDGDGSKGRIIALGTVGKLLPSAYVAGVPTHSGFPLNGINAAALASSIAAHVEWATELTEDCGSSAGTPPSLLGIRDGKAGYDVTTPASAFATFNVLSYRRTPDEVLDRFDRLCAEAASNLLGELKRRSQTPDAIENLANPVPLYRFEALVEHLGADERDRLDAYSASIAGGDLPLPEKCRLVTQEAWGLSRLSGPAIVTGFGSIPYLPTNLSDAPAAARLKTVATQIARDSAERYGSTIACADYFAGISDMSFFGEAAESSLDIVARNTPAWKHSVRWTMRQGLANLPTINIGPWGRDYHTPLERLHMGYAFEVLPQAIRDLCAGLLQPSGSRPDGSSQGDAGVS
ncbi:M20/M25/M40 family metallo-hydrolase [Mesorhizobium sp. B4-1-3]|uniref:M20/M25/M40 family metallo-hydrolase n=1 Tax=Mesorhizobium sp. B4-1-3 TaxID=2589889 RepID=UPI00112BF7FB|nr:M20/M25/M40 family metallo-hydrolase [Mesorhizobium sp. B4-1-3]TPI12947.1 M20/M25/M40 family metallo-hydrolase [Mesorhizobium sp. B4-1-3]